MGWACEQCNDKLAQQVPLLPSVAVFPPKQCMRNISEPNLFMFCHQKQKNIHLENNTCSLLIEAIKGKIIGLSRAGSSDIQTTAAATKEVTVTCKLLWAEKQFIELSRKSMYRLPYHNSKNESQPNLNAF